MKTIVTGGAGFIGSHLVRRLLNDGNEVSVIDNLHSGSMENISDLSSKIKFKKDNGAAIANMPYADVVFHIGIFSSTPMYRNDRNLMYIAIKDFVAVAEYCVKNKSKLVLTSSSSIYNGHKPPHREDMVPYAKDFYTEARYMMERTAEVYRQMMGLEYVALRPFSVYGDGEESKKQYANVISQLLWKGILGNEFVIYGDGSQRRDFVNVEDMVEANILAWKKGVSGVFNVGNGKSYSFNEALEMVEQVMGKKIKMRYAPNPLKNYVDIVEADTKKMKQELGFEPKVKLRDGIAKALQYYTSRRQVPDIP